MKKYTQTLAALSLAGVLMAPALALAADPVATTTAPTTNQTSPLSLEN